MRRLHVPGRVRTGMFGLILALALPLIAPATVSASYFTSQIAYDDDQYQTNSVKVDCRTQMVPPCYNQNNQSNFTRCFNTPNTFTHDYDWWYQGGILLYEYTSTNCTGSSFATITFTLPTGTAHGWYCTNRANQNPWEC
jgi:hypothetical protein